MKILKDYQFDFTTEPSAPSNCPTFRENIFQKKQEVPSKISTTKKKSPKKYFNQFANNSFSSSKSQLSIISFPPTQQYNVHEHIDSIQQKIFQQVLSLREQKLTLMQQHNLATHERHRVQRQLAKYKKNMKNEVAELQKEEQIKQKKVAQTLEKICQNENQACNLLNHNYLSSNSEYYLADQQETIQKINYLRKYSQQIQKQLRQPNQLPFPKFPLQPEKTFEKISSKDYIKCLKTKKQKLLHMIISQTQQQQLRKCLLSLIKSNEQLQSVIDWHFYHQKYILECLRVTVKDQETKKKQFLQQIIQFKSKIKHLKLQNQQLRKAITYFRF